MDGSHPFTLDEKYTLETGRAYMTGVQALVRLPLAVRRRDWSAGRDTAGFISGYRGSPLGGYDSALWQAQGHLDDHQILFQSGVNEDMAATACWGTQQAGLFGAPKHEGVFAIWYGKGPGVDRSGDPLKHGNLAGTAPLGGVLVLTGDDHMAKSSTTAHQSEPALVAAMIPVFNPADVQELLDYGQIAIAMSRYSGCWVGLKCLGDTVESAASVAVDPARTETVIPADFELPADGVHIRWPDDPRSQEARLLNVKLKAAQAFVRANGLDRVTHGALGGAAGEPSPKRLGIVAAGKAWLDVCQAFEELGLSDAERAELGISVYKVAVPWPLEPETLRAYAAGHQELLVVEEKRNLMEDQIARALYDLPAASRPRLVGKRDEAGRPLVPEHGELSGTMVARIIAGRFLEEERRSCLQDAVARLAQRTRSEGRNAGLTERKPWFCAGCPHNTSTRVPAGSMALSGIGCHTLAVHMDRNTGPYTQMGGEGGAWIGQAPFTTTGHVFQNMGDGTYYHSGLLAVRAAVRAGVNITYKILYNDAVAMTGGQPVEGGLSPADITRQIRAEGVGRIAVVTDEPEKYSDAAGWAPGVEIRHRDELDAVQREMREEPGVTAIVYDQTCAAEKRRRRKRGTYPDPDTRLFINEMVCEGCGDCGKVSNCVAVRPHETPFGLKRRIDQSSCNKDFSCLDGFCPSFVTVEGGTLKKSAKPAVGAKTGDPADGLPEPVAAPVEGAYNVLLAGIGGTGVVTVGALLGVAAHLDGRGVSVLDQTGLSQKNGAVTTHVRVFAEPGLKRATRIGAGLTDVLLGFDMIAAAGDGVLRTLSPGRSRAVVNDHVVPLAAFAEDPDMNIGQDGYRDAITALVGRDAATMFDVTRIAEEVLGDTITSNIFQLGFALQKGYLPVSAGALAEAIRLNGVAVDGNLRALAWGRVAAAAPERVAALTEAPAAEAETETLDDVIRRRADSLIAYQNVAYSDAYAALVKRVREAEAAVMPGRTDLTDAVARNLYKLMAYKDEYEVARLFTDGRFEKRLKEQFEGDFKIAFNFAPPLFAKTDPVTGAPRKMEYSGNWYFVLKALAAMKGLRGGPLDLFGYTADRRQERQLVKAYRGTVEEILGHLGPETYETAVTLARLPERVRGYGHIKRKSVDDMAAEAKDLRARLVAAPATVQAAE